MLVTRHQKNRFHAADDQIGIRSQQFYAEKQWRAGLPDLPARTVPTTVSPP